MVEPLDRSVAADDSIGYYPCYLTASLSRGTVGDVEEDIHASHLPLGWCGRRRIWAAQHDRRLGGMARMANGGAVVVRLYLRVWGRHGHILGGSFMRTNCGNHLQGTSKNW